MESGKQPHLHLATKKRNISDEQEPKSKRLKGKIQTRKDEEDKAIEEAKDMTKWETKGKNFTQNLGTILFADFGAKASDKIAGFDMDSTLINTKSGKTFAQNSSDWVWWDRTVPKKLKEAHEDGYKIVIFSNQAGISTGKVVPATLKGKFIQLFKSCKVPFQALCATASDGNRKPGTGMWKSFCKNYNDGVEPDKKSSFYVGDAAGRPKTKTRKKDFSDSDRKFAINVGIDFHTPESYFLNKKEKLPPLAFDIKKLKSLEGKSPSGEEEKYAKEEQEMIIFVGSPGAGKSTFWHNHLSDYVRVNNDTLKTKEKCMKVARQALKEGKSCVIDNTNKDADIRKRYTAIAEECKVPCRAFYFDIPKEI